MVVVVVVAFMSPHPHSFVFIFWVADVFWRVQGTDQNVDGLLWKHDRNMGLAPSNIWTPLDIICGC